MRVKKMVKKIVALGIGATMVGATILGASAQDLSEYPDMLVSNGTFDGYLVVGGNAADNLAVIDISNNMYYTTSEDATTETSVEGDAWQVATSTKILEINESIAEVESYIDDSDLDALADGSIVNEKGTANYEQFLYFDNTGSEKVVYEENDNEELELFFKITSGQQIARYELDFTEDLESDVDSGDLEDVEDEQISILGKTYDIVKAENISAGVKLTLMAGSVRDTIDEGDSQTYTIDGEEYNVELTFTDINNRAKFRINGETTDLLTDGDTDKLSDGTIIGVSEVLYQDYAGGVHQAEFFLGANKLILQNGTSLEVNDEDIDEADVTITSSSSGGDVSISDISVNMTADDDFFVGAGEKLSENPELDEPEVLITGNWDIQFMGMKDDDSTAVKLSPRSGDEKYTLEFSNLNDDEIDIPLVFANASGTYGGDKSGHELVLNKSDSITDDDYFILNTADASSDSSDAITYVLQYDGSDACTDDNAKIKFDNLATGNSIERSIGTDGTFDIKLGGQTFYFNNASACSDDDFPIQMNGIGTEDDGDDYSIFGTAPVLGNYIRTNYNGLIEVYNVNTTEVNGTWVVNVTTDDDDRKDDKLGAVDEEISFSITYDDGDDELDLSSGTTPTYWEADPDNDDVTMGYTIYGTWVKQTSPSGSADTLEFAIPESQAEMEVYITSGAVQTSSTTSGALARVTIPVTATKLPEEVSDVSAQNGIYVGGPCANSATSEVMYDSQGEEAPADCAADFTPGEAMIKLYNVGDNVALVIAGYSADDTRRAGKVLAQYDQYDLSGEEATVSGTSFTDISVSSVE